ncbi:hypothetical protein JAAARDRAFT_171241 [Jaapia argillacea MUCL 33604]|uniref:NADP-dependent oxidoreductase domain-containing protein n=1 Tax=Jaapia argillacea MUCL 33604 TaxID=933084 RepID=A0A067Q928_9AGAM|nr:hypothetical protein JAAARDRAFT_171241 [Jaapia argillacea MUCL 33604]
MPFETVTLNDGNKIPAIAFGTGSVWKGHSVTEYVEQAIETGFSHIDTAAIYGNEDTVGTALREVGLDRDDLYVTTKYDGGDIQEAVHSSLSKLGLKQLDLYLIHAPSFVEGKLESAWQEFEKIKETGLAKSIGVSNFTVKDLQQVIKSAKVKPAVNQIRFHPYNYSENKTLLEYSGKHGIITEAYGSLYPITQAPGGPVDKVLAAVGKRIGANPGQVIFKWVQAKGVVIVTTSSKKERLEEYLAVADLPPLTEEEIAAIDAAGAKGPPKPIRRHIATALWMLLIMYWFAGSFLDLSRWMGDRASA